MRRFVWAVMGCMDWSIPLLGYLAGELQGGTGGQSGSSPLPLPELLHLLLLLLLRHLWPEPLLSPCPCCSHRSF